MSTNFMARLPDAVDEYPATHLVHWPSGPVPCCVKHAKELCNLGQFMGAHIAATKIVDAAQCTNCVNENCLAST